MTRPAHISGALLGSGIALFCCIAQADTLDELMRQLKAKGILKQREYDAMRERYKNAPAAAPGREGVVNDLIMQLRAKGILNERDYADLEREQKRTTVQQPVAGVQPGAEPATVQSTQQASPPQSTAAPETASTGPSIRMMDKGIGLHLGTVDVSIAGSVNTFYTHDIADDPNGSTRVLGGLATTGNNDSASIRNGLLPGNFTANIKTKQSGYDIGVTFGLYPGLNSVSGDGGANTPGNPAGLGTSGIDFRQQFITVGNDKVGTFKAGRDIGVFGSDGILNDWTLLSVGSPGSNVAPSNTALGRIGLGYVYTDFFPQINYTHSITSNLDGTIGAFSPFRAVNFSGASGVLSAHDQPGFHGKLNFKDTFGDLKTQLWTSFITQQLTSDGGTDALPTGKSVRGYGLDLGGKLSYGKADLTGYGYYGDGLGTTALFFDAVSATGLTRQSWGYYIQGAYEILPRLTVGVSQGASYLELADGEVNPLLVNINESQLIGLRYELTDWVRIIAEYVHTRTEAHGGNEANEHTVALGAALYF